jgi:hypothetical protein
MTEMTFRITTGQPVIAGTAPRPPLFAGAVHALARAWVAATSRSNHDRVAREAKAVRDLARRYDKTDRGFASDVYAAADRHEDIAAGGRAGSAGPSATAR